MFLLHIIIPFLFILSCLFILLYDDLGLVSFAEFTTNNLPYLNADRKKLISQRLVTKIEIKIIQNLVGFLNSTPRSHNKINSYMKKMKHLKKTVGL